MVVPRNDARDNNGNGILIVFLPILILLLAGLQGAMASEPIIVDNGDFSFTATWDFSDMTNYTLDNLNASNGNINLSVQEFFWSQLDSSDFSNGQRTNVVEGDGVVISTDDLVLGYIQNQNFSTPYGWNYNNGTESMVLARWSPSEYGELVSSHEKNSTTQNIEFNSGSTILYDTYLDENNPLANHGGENTLRVQRGFLQRRRPVLWFDVSILEGTSILDAQLQLYHYNGVPGTDLSISAHTVLSPWAENTANWDTYDGTNDWPINNDGGDYNAVPLDWRTVSGMSMGWISWDITSLVDGWASQSIPNNGVLLKESGLDDTWKDFHSSNYFTPSLTPKLTVQYFDSHDFNETANITQDFPVLDPGAYRDTSASDFEAGTLDTVSVIPASGGEIILDSESFLKFDTLDDVSIWVEDPSTSTQKGVKKSSTTYRMEGTGSMWLDYTLPNDQINYGVMRTTGGPWDWSGYTDLVIWANSSGQGELMKLILKDTIGITWESSTPLLPVWKDYTFDLTDFNGDISAINEIKLHFSDSTDPTNTYIDNITLLGGAPFYENGNFTSRVIDGGYPTLWETVLWSENTPGGSSVEITTRTGNTSIPDTSWSGWSSPYGDPSGSPVTSPRGRYIQYKAYLSTPDDGYTPSLSEVIIVKSEYNLTFTYSVDSFVNITWAHLYLRLNDVILWEEFLSGTSASSPVTFDMGRYLYATGENPIEFSLNVEGDTIDGMNVSVTIDDFQIQGPFGYFISQVHDTGSEAFWGNVTWESEVPASTNLVLRTRTSPDNVSWSAWFTPSDFADQITNPSGRYIQYNVNLSTDVLGISPIFKWINISYTKYASSGTLTFDKDLVVENITGWGQLVTDSKLNGQIIDYEYSIDSGLNWNPIAPDLNLSSVSVSTKKIRFRANLITTNTSVTPILDSIKLIYNVNNPPKIVGVVPHQTQLEDGGSWSIDLTIYESDFEDTGDKLRWFLTGENLSLYNLVGEYSSDDVITFYPEPDAYGNDLVTLWLEDSFGERASQDLWINITPVNDPPKIQGVIPSYDKTENDPNWQIDLSGYKYDVDNSPGELSWSVIGWDTSLFDSVSISGNILTFDLAPDAYGNDVMKVVLNDAMYAVSQDIWVNVSFINKAPVINGVIPDFTVPEDDPAWVADLTSYEWDREDPVPSTSLSWSVWGFDPSLLSLTVSDNNITFTPKPDAHGNNEITITLTDSLGLSTSQRIWVNITAVNDAPIIFGTIPNFYVNEDAPNWNYDLGIYKRDIDNSSSDLSFSVTGWDNLLFDSVNLVGDVVYFDLAQDAFGNNEMTITLTDGILSDIQNIWVNISGVNDAPWISGILVDYTKVEDAVFWTLDLTSFERDIEDGSPSEDLVWSVTGVNSSLLQLDINDNNITFNLIANAYGNDEITLILSDSQGAFVTKRIWVNVSAENDAPDIIGIIPNFEKNEDAANWMWDLSGYMYDVDNPKVDMSWSVSQWDTSLFDSVFIAGNAINFDLVPNAYGNDEITLTLSDGILSVSQNIWVNVTQINDAPQIVGTIDDFLKTEDELPWIFDLTNYEYDIEDGGPFSGLTWSVSGIDSSLLSIKVSDNNLTFTLIQDAFGNNEITLLLRDSSGMTDSITFWVNVTGVNDAPRVQGIIPSFQKNEDAAIWNLDLSGYKYDIDNSSGELSWQTSGWDIFLFDSVIVAGDMVTFDLKQNAHGNSQITLILSDGIETAVQNFWVNVTSVNDPPQINGIIQVMDRNEDDPKWTLDLTSFEFDIESTPPSSDLTWSVTGVDPSLLTISINDNNITFTLVPNAYGSCEITVHLTDGDGGYDSQKVWINVAPQNDAPVILGIIPNHERDEDAPLWNLDLSTYKWDVDDNPSSLTWSVSNWDGVLFDSVMVTGDILSFDIAPNRFGNDIVTLVLSDGSLSVSKDFWVNVTSINDAPRILGTILDIQRPEDSPNWILDLTSYEYDVEDGSPSSSLVWSVTQVNSSLLSVTVLDNLLTFSLVKDAYGYDYITITLTDSGGLSISQNVLVEIIPTNDIPWIQPSVPNIVLDEDSKTSLDLLSYAHDVEDTQDSLRWSISGANNSIYSWYIDPSTKVLYINPLPNAYGTDDVVITVMDGSGGWASQSLQVVVISVNDAPYISPKIPESLFETLEDDAIAILLAGYENDVEDGDVYLRWDVLNVDKSIIRVTLNTATDKLVVVPVVVFSSDDSDIVETQISLVLTDSGGLSASQNITVKIIPVNNAPVLDDLPDLMIRFDKPYLFDFTAYAYDEDTELDQLILTTSEPKVDTKEGYINVEGLKITFHYPESRNGDSLSVLITLSDGQLSDYAIMQVTIWDHSPPELLNPIPDVYFDEDTSMESAFDLDNHFVGYNDGALNYTYFMDYTHHGEEYVFVSITQNNTVDFFAASNWYGVEYITFRAEDGYGAIAETTIKVTVYPVNDAPTILDIPDQECKVNVSKTINLGPYISDPDTPSESLMISTDSPYITASGHSIILRYPDITKEIVNIFVLDGFSQSSTSIEVTAEANKPPTISIIPDLVVRGGEVYLFSLLPYINDPDDDIKNLLVWTDSTHINQNNGDNLLLQIDFPIEMIGQDLDVTLYVSDGQLTNSTNVPIHITDEMVPKRKADIPNLFFEEDMVLHEVLNLNEYFENAQTYQFFGNDKVNINISQGLVTVSALANWSGTEMVTIRAVLGEAFVEDTIEIIVKPIDDPPVMSTLPSYDKKVGVIWILNLNDHITDIDTPTNLMTISVDSTYVIFYERTIYFQYQFPINEIITITVSDGVNTVKGIVRVNVTVDNHPPAYLGLLSTTRIKSGETWEIDLDLYFHDSDGNDLTFSCNKEEITINPITNTATWTPKEGDTRLEDVIFTASDGLISIESSPIDLIVDEEEESMIWWLFILLALVIIILTAFILLRREAEEEEEEYDVPVHKAVEYLSTKGGGNYIIKSSTSDSSYQVFAGLLKRGYEGLCITTKATGELTNRYDLGKAWIIKLALRGHGDMEGENEETRMMGLLALGDEERNDDKYIFSLNFNRIVETIEEFLTTGEKKVVLLDGLEYILGGEELIMYIGFIASLRERMKDRNSCLLIPIDPKTLSEKELGLLERETIELGKVIQEQPKAHHGPLDIIGKKIEEEVVPDPVTRTSDDAGDK